MNKNKILVSVFFVLGLSLISTAIVSAKHPIDEYEIMAEVSPPYNYINDNGQPDGLMTEILLLILREMGAEKKATDINFSYPWTRSYHIAQTQQKKILFTMAITQVRSRFFRWGGPVLTTNIALFALKESSISIKSSADLVKYKIGIIKDDISETLLSNLPEGSKLWLYDASTLEALITQLRLKRLSLFSYENQSALWLINHTGNTDLFTPVYILKDINVSFAFSSDTPDSIINDFNAAWDRVKRSKEFPEILKNYKFSADNIK